MPEDKLRDILNNLRASNDPSVLAFIPDDEGQNLMLRNLPAAILIRDAEEGIVLESNDYALKMLGVERKRLIGSTLADLELNIHFDEELSGSSASGNPRRARITDSEGIEIPAVLFTRKIDINGKRADLFIVLDVTLLDPTKERLRVPRYNMLKKCLGFLSEGYMIAEIAGGKADQDLIVIEMSDRLPLSMDSAEAPGASISRFFAPVDAEEIVRAAIRASDTGDTEIVNSKKAGKISIFPGATSLVLLCFNSRSEMAVKDHIQVTEEPSGTGAGKSVLLLAPDRQDSDFGADMLKMLGFSVVTVTSPGQALKTYRENPDGYLFLMADLQSVQLETKELMTLLKKNGKSMILASHEVVGSDLPDGFKNSCLSKPYSINDLAAAVSEMA